MSFLIRDGEVWEKFDIIWDTIKDKLGIKFHNEPVYEYKYLKAKVRELDGVIKTNFLGNDMPKENIHYTCNACITIDSILKIDTKNYPQVYLEDSAVDSALDSEKVGSKFDNELMAELEKSGSDSE